MSDRSKAVFLLMFLSPALTELVTGSTTVTDFFHPVGLVFLLLGYSLPVLLLRERAVRNGLGYASLIALGVAYGIYNEGLWAKTIVQPTELPIRQFDHYGRYLGINLPWALVISFYHAFAAILVPILVVHVQFPRMRDTPWLSVRLGRILGVFLVLAAIANFLGPLRSPGHPVQLIILLGGMAIAVIAARALTRWRSSSIAAAPVKGRTFFLGISSFSAWLILPILAELRVPLLVFIAIFASGVFLYLFVLKKIGLSLSNLLLFAAGFYVQSALLALAIGALIGSVERVATASVIILVSSYFAWKLVYRPASTLALRVEEAQRNCQPAAEK
jgi:hypothetical protein